jgi:stage V sporulation protein G
VAFASCVVDDDLYLGNIAVMTRTDGSGYRLVFPTKKIGETNIPIYHPINALFSDRLTEAIEEKINLIMR